MSDYKKICVPIVKIRFARNGVQIHDITIRTHKRTFINLYRSLPDDYMIVDNIVSAIAFINKICNINGYRTEIFDTDFNANWYDILFLDIDTNNVKRYGIPRKD